MDIDRAFHCNSVWENGNERTARSNHFQGTLKLSQPGCVIRQLHYDNAQHLLAAKAVPSVVLGLVDLSSSLKDEDADERTVA